MRRFVTVITCAFAIAGCNGSVPPATPAVAVAAPTSAATARPAATRLRALLGITGPPPPRLPREAAGTG